MTVLNETFLHVVTHVLTGDMLTCSIPNKGT